MFWGNVDSVIFLWACNEFSVISYGNFFILLPTTQKTHFMFCQKLFIPSLYIISCFL